MSLPRQKGTGAPGAAGALSTRPSRFASLVPLRSRRYLNCERFGYTRAPHTLSTIQGTLHRDAARSAVTLAPLEPPLSLGPVKPPTTVLLVCPLLVLVLFPPLSSRARSPSMSELDKVPLQGDASAPVSPSTLASLSPVQLAIAALGPDLEPFIRQRAYSGFLNRRRHRLETARTATASSSGPHRRPLRKRNSAPATSGASTRHWSTFRTTSSVPARWVESVGGRTGAG